MRGRALITKRGKHVAPAMECLKQAVELDPSFAAAWGGLGRGVCNSGVHGHGTARRGDAAGAHGRAPGGRARPEVR